MQNELYHVGIKGMRWGHRKSPEFESKNQQKIKELNTAADNEYKQSRVYKWQQNQIKKHGDYNPDDGPNTDNDYHYQKSLKLKAEARSLKPDFVKGRVKDAVIPTTIIYAPVAMLATNAVLKKVGVKGKKKASIILASGLAVTSYSAIASAKIANDERKATESKYGIK